MKFLNGIIKMFQKYVDGLLGGAYKARLAVFLARFQTLYFQNRTSAGYRVITQKSEIVEL